MSRQLRKRTALLPMKQPLAIPNRLPRMRLVLVISSIIAAAGLQGASGAPSNFSFTESLATARDGHVATLLPNGKVLVAGGSGGTGPLVSAELYDPATGSWSGTGSAASPFVLATATLLQNGKVLVVGSLDRVTHLYDPATGSWTTTGNLNQGRRLQSATLLPSGKVLVAGGSDINGTSLATAEIYDPVTGAWTPTDALAKRRSGHTATLLGNGKVLVAGGYFFVPPANGDDGVVESAEIYDPATGVWSATGGLQSARAGHTATLLPNGTVLVAGGSNVNLLATAEVYDRVTETWTATGSLAAERYAHTATLLPNGRVLVVGGTSYVATAELYDPGVGSWSAAGDLRNVRAYHSATLLANGRVLVAAGSAGPPLASAELYDPDSLTAQVQLQNIATRLKVLTGDKVLIGGFIITGSAPKKVMLRGIGPSLPLVGLLADPTLELHLGNGSTVTNDNWKIDDQTGQSQEAEIQATTIPPLNELEPALVRTLNPGNYTAIIRGKNGGQGIALVEAYDLDTAAASELANISTRGFVNSGDDVMIGGIILGPLDRSAGEVMVRALGPSLVLADSLADPMLELRNSNGDKLISNDNWKLSDSTGQSQEAQIRATTIHPSNDFESAFVILLQPGSYTAIVSGKNGGTGIGLVEVYNLH
jgi:N-acetylneuraminic acid mutarotase